MNNISLDIQYHTYSHISIAITTHFEKTHSSPQIELFTNSFYFAAEYACVEVKRLRNEENKYFDKFSTICIPQKFAIDFYS